MNQSESVEIGAKMRIETYNFYNEEAKTKIKVNEFMKKNFKQIDSMFKYFKEFNPNQFEEYLEAFQKRLTTETEERISKIDIIRLEDIDQDLTVLDKYPKLEEAIILFFLTKVGIPKSIDDIDEEIVITYYNLIKTERFLSYYKVKAIEDIMGKEKGIKLYKEIIECLIRDTKEQDTSKKPEDPSKVTRLESRKFILNHYKTNGVANFTMGIYDDFKEIYRFDKCIVHEVLKGFNDPDIAYLSSCYHRDSPSSNEGHTIHMSRTQTLHHSSFCDELYWNTFVHPDAEQPSLEFVKNMEKDFIPQIIENSDGTKIIAVDFTPFKTCNYNCIYCTLGPTTIMANERTNFYPVEEVFNSIKSYYETNETPDITVLTGSGEPTLYSGIGVLATKVKELGTKTKTKIITNGSFLIDEQVRTELMNFDIIQLNLDSVIQEEFKKVGRMYREIKLENVIKGAEEMVKEFQGHFNIQIKFLRNVNDSTENIQKLKTILTKINPDSIDVVKVKPYKTTDLEMVTDSFVDKLKEEWSDLSSNLRVHF